MIASSVGVRSSLALFLMKFEIHRLRTSRYGLETALRSRSSDLVIRFSAWRTPKFNSSRSTLWVKGSCSSILARPAEFPHHGGTFSQSKVVSPFFPIRRRAHSSPIFFSPTTVTGIVTSRIAWTQNTVQDYGIISLQPKAWFWCRKPSRQPLNLIE